MAAGLRYIASSQTSQKTTSNSSLVAYARCLAMALILLLSYTAVACHGCFLWLHNSCFQQICHSVISLLFTYLVHKLMVINPKEFRILQPYYLNSYSLRPEESLMCVIITCMCADIATIPCLQTCLCIYEGTVL
jgi:hypothetical protein